MMPTEPTTPLYVLFARVFWMMLGPIILVLLAFSIIDIGTGWFTLADFAFFGVLGGLLLARQLEFRGGDPRTAMGEPASPSDRHRYMLGALALGLVLWVFANLLGNHWLTR